MTTEPDDELDDELDDEDECPLRTAIRSVDQSLVKLYAALERAKALVNQMIAAGNDPPPDEPAR